LDRDKRLITFFLPEFNLWAEDCYEVVAWPDVDTRDHKAVDAIARNVAGRELAIEHTLLQPFSGERSDTVPFLKTAGLLDRRADLAEPNWMIDVVFRVGAIPKGVDWNRVGQYLEEWFVAIRPTLVEGRQVCEISGLPFDLRVTVDKSSLPGSPGKLFVMRAMPDEDGQDVLRAALAAKLPKLAAAPAEERILLLERDVPACGYWETGEAIDSMQVAFNELSMISSVWIADTVAWESEDYLAFHLIWPLDQALGHQEWYKVRPNRRLHATAAGRMESGRA
jgi:hypothetical protein